VGGNLRMKPTVSVTRAGRLPGRDRRRVVGSRVANSLSATTTLARVSELRRVLLPALV
jgi:hypothetical protein